MCPYARKNLNEMTKLIDFIVKNNWGDVASIIGLIITIISFIVILINVLRSKRAAEQAKVAVAQVREDLLKVDTVAEFSSALSCMDEIRRLHRQEAWEILPDRYSALKKSLISIKSSNPNMSDEHKKVIQSTIQIFTSIADQVETSLSLKESPPDIAKLNQIISKHIDKLQQVLIEIKKQIGR